MIIIRDEMDITRQATVTF